MLDNNISISTKYRVIRLNCLITGVIYEYDGDFTEKQEHSYRVKKSHYSNKQILTPSLSLLNALCLLGTIMNVDCIRSFKYDTCTFTLV